MKLLGDLKDIEYIIYCYYTIDQYRLKFQR